MVPASGKRKSQRRRFPWMTDDLADDRRALSMWPVAPMKSKRYAGMKRSNQ
jgi:hypothetical protein